jgi:uncharacterized protein YxeA
LAEKIVLDYERWFLKENNLPKLSEKTRILDTHGSGYDILSFNLDGSEKYIEVKSNSSSNKNNGFYISSNELEHALDHKTVIYYVTDLYDEHPKIHTVNFNEESLHKLKPVNFWVNL